MNRAFSAAMVWLNGFSEGFCSGGVLTVEAEAATRTPPIDDGDIVATR